MRLSKWLWYWLPPVLWMAAIFSLSTDAFSGGETGSMLSALLDLLHINLSASQTAHLNYLLRKLAHFTGYAVLSLLLLRALRGERRGEWRWRWAAWAFLITALYALIDEYHQSLTRTRTGSLGDSLLDMAGGLAGLALWWISWRRRPARGAWSGRAR